MCFCRSNLEDWNVSPIKRQRVNSEESVDLLADGFAEKPASPGSVYDPSASFHEYWADDLAFEKDFEDTLNAQNIT